MVVELLALARVASGVCAPYGALLGFVRGREAIMAPAQEWSDYHPRAALVVMSDLKRAKNAKASDNNQSENF